MADDEPEILAGGNMGVVVRVGDTVVRQVGDWTPAVHRLLRHLERHGVQGVPRVRGRTGDGREVLSFVPGTVPSWPLPAWLWHEKALVSSARLLRRIHDASAGADRSGPWRSPVHDPQEVVCHNDFATYNLVFDDGLAVGAIDWDFSSPGPRIWDLAYLGYRIVPMTTVDEGDGFTKDQRRQRLDLLLREYGTDASLQELVMVLHGRLLELAEFSDRMADELGRPELMDHAVQYRRDAAVLPRV